MMRTLLVRNIASLVGADDHRQTLLRGKEMGALPVIAGAFLLIRGDRIVDYGPAAAAADRADAVVDAGGGMVFPGWCDSHTHLVFAGSRESEFVDRIRGLSYAEIARRGGGILNSARRLRETPEEKLVEDAMARLQEVAAMGTCAIEIKSGYGLSLEGELKMLRVIRQLKERSRLTIKATFLGAHALPEAYLHDRKAYLRLVIEEMLPRIAAEGLADYIDVFCEKGFFSVDETREILQAGRRHGLPGKVHTNQFNALGGIEACIEEEALSVDHLEVVTEEEILRLRQSSTIPTLLPTAPFFLNDPYPPARQMIDAGLGVALASDFNPGSSPSGRMPLVVSLACIKMKMTPAEAINAATHNGACAMEVQDLYGSIGRGKSASFFITKPIPSIDYLPYAFGSNLIDQVFINGEKVYQDRSEFENFS